ncbi:MAG: glycoside hydrolase family 140 protein [Phycisphaerae bacterium]
MNAMIALAAGIGALAAGAAAEEPVYPVKVSSTGRYFVDQKDRPVFWLGTTQWQLFRDNTPEEADVILANVKDKGFSFVQVMLAGVGDGTRPNAGGQKPWINDDPLRPNEAYFRNVDAALASARKNNVNISLTLYHQRWRKLITESNARAWATWLAKRYKDVPTIVWSMTPEARKEFVPVLRELAAGLKEGDGGAHLITFKPDPAPYSSSFLHEESWLAFDCMQVWKRIDLIYPMVTKDYRLKPVKPVVMAEGAYEAGTEYGFDVTPLWVRREAWYSYLCGAHHTYGHNDSWRMLPTWKKSLDAPGAVQMGILKRVLTARGEWWALVPDQGILAAGGNTKGNVLNLAARHADGKWMLAYLGAKAAFSIRLDKLTAGGRATAFWIDPRTGNSTPAGSFPNKGTQPFTTPQGWEDAVLVLESSP